MGPDALLTVVVMGGCAAGLLFTRIAPDAVLMAGLVVLLISGVVSPVEGLGGFANPGTITVAAFYVIAAGLRETGALDLMVGPLFRDTHTVRKATVRMTGPVMIMSAFVANTPIVASFLPAVADWARQRGLSPSQLLMPLSYAAILGGTCTLAGTTTNLVVNGMLIDATGGDGLGFFEMAWVGLPCAVLGFVYLVAAGPALLPRRSPALEELRDIREYTVEMLVSEQSALAGKTVEEAGLRHLNALFLIEIDRAGMALPAVSSDEVLRVHDRLVFAGASESVLDLQQIRGLEPATDQVFKLEGPRSERRFFEAVVGRDSPYAGRSIRESRFRTRCGAVVIAVARNGSRVRGKLGDIEIEAGDTLLLESGQDFADRQRAANEFLLIRPIDGVSLRRHERAPVAWGILGVVVVTATTGWLSLLQASLLGAGTMVAGRCCTVNAARSSVDLQVILVIAAAFGIGNAMQVSGAGSVIGTSILAIGGDHPLTLLAAIYLATSLLTALITNNAAAVLIFPVAMAAAGQAGIPAVPIAVTVAMAASASFITPIGYQTNLMVYGPGGYRASDYLRFGLPLHLALGVVTVLLVPVIWPLQ
ncbi:MAG: SLC13 family permease [Gammaproteobacteria bacterium]